MSTTHDNQTNHSALALQLTSTMISTFDAEFDMQYCNEAARISMAQEKVSLMQRLVNESDFQSIKKQLSSAEHCELEVQVNTVQGIRWHNLHIQQYIDPVSGKKMYVTTENDATTQRTAQANAYQLAYTDSLTSLPNRAALNNHLHERLESMSSEHFAVMFMDLDRFKIINDSLGHAAGDQLLVEVAQRLKHALGDRGHVFRLGGDEFVALSTQDTERATLINIAETILLTVSAPLTLAGHKLRILPSIGISIYPADGSRASVLMENADMAMYIAKSRQSGFRFYDAKMSSSISENVKNRMDLENDMVTAVLNDEFELYFQPKIDCRTLKVTGVEGLIRWNHPQRGLVCPDDFISIAEDTGQIIDVGYWVLEAAMRQQRRWHQQGLEVSVSVNISPRQFRSNDLLDDVSRALLETGCDPRMIELEITESMLIGDPDAVNETLLRLSAIGIRLALDDFGTGFANLDSLQKYPLDCLKVDRIFLSDRKRSMLMSTILKMGKALGLEIVAEGVETRSQTLWLAANGCDVMQGFYFSEPLPAQQITQYLLEHSGPQTGMSKAA